MTAQRATKTKLPTAANTNKVRTIDDMSADWLAAKRAETDANERRLAIETEIIGELGALPEGSETHNFPDFKVVVTGKLNRKLDAEIWKSVADQIPVELRPVTAETVFKLDDKGCRWLAENRPELWNIASKAIETKPAKTSIKVEPR